MRPESADDSRKLTPGKGLFAKIESLEMGQIVRSLLTAAGKTMPIVLPLILFCAHLLSQMIIYLAQQY